MLGDKIRISHIKFCLDFLMQHKTLMFVPFFPCSVNLFACLSNVVSHSCCVDLMMCHPHVMLPSSPSFVLPSGVGVVLVKHQNAPIY